MRAYTPLSVVISMVIATQAHADTATTAEATLSPLRIEAKTTQPTEAQDSSVTTLTDQTIEQNLSTDLESLLRYEPGVGVTKDARFGIGSINIRGLDGDRVKMLVDGVEQADAYGPTTTYLRTGRGKVDLESLEAVSIVKGGDVVEGSGALGGAVVMQTKRPASYLEPEGDDTYVALKSGYRDASDQFSNTLTVANRSGDLESLLVYTHRKGQETDTYGGTDTVGPTRGEADPGEFDGDNLLGKLEYQLNDHNRIGVVGEYYTRSSAFDLKSESTDTATRRSDDEDTRKRLGVWQQYDGQTAMSDTLRWQLDYQTSKTQNGTYIDTDASSRFVDRFYDEKSLQASLDAEKQVGAHRLKYGAELSRESLENLNKNTVDGATTASRFSPKADGTKVGLYLQDEWVVNNALTLLPAVRFDAYRYNTESDQYIDAWGDNKDQALTAQIGANYAFTDEISAFGKYGTGFRAPDMDDLYFYFENSGYGYAYRIRPNPELDPERSVFLETGVRYEDAYRSVELVAFYNRYRDFIEQISLGANATYNYGEFTNVNIDKVTITGLELKTAWDLGALNPYFSQGWQAQLSAAYADGENTGDNEPLNSIAPMTVVAGLGYQHPSERYGGQLNITFAQGKDKSDVTSDKTWLSTPDHTLVDLTTFYKPTKNIKVAVGVFNLLDEEYWVWNDIRGISNTSTNLARYTQPGRNFGLDVTVSF
jgi:hemoglobin/transferrin/lactoferrin receptor protein